MLTDRDLDLLQRALDLRRTSLVGSQDDDPSYIHRMIVRNMIKENDILRLKINAIRKAQGVTL